MQDRPVAQATGSHNSIIEVYPDRVELHSGWQNQSTERLDLRDISAVKAKGLVNCTLTIVTNKGREYTMERLALPEARDIKSSIENYKQRAGLYD